MRIHDSVRRVLSAPLLPTLGAVLLIGSVAPACADVGMDIDVAPPTPRIVKVPPPRPGFVWAPGYYRWDGHQHIWVDGRFIKERPGFHWVAEQWTKHRGRYHFEPGQWVRD